MICQSNPTLLSFQLDSSSDVGSSEMQSRNHNILIRVDQQEISKCLKLHLMEKAKNKTAVKQNTWLLSDCSNKPYTKCFYFVEYFNVILVCLVSERGEPTHFILLYSIFIFRVIHLIFHSDISNVQKFLIKNT